MSLVWIRKRFDVPARRGSRVLYVARCDEEELYGVITGSRGARLLVRFDGNKKSDSLHPKYRITYYCKNQEDIERYGMQYTPIYTDNDDDL